MIKRIAIVAVLIFLSISATALAAEGDGTLEGQLVNGTANGSSLANQEITLKIYQSGVESASNTTTTDAEGSFIFDGLSTATEYSYEVTLFYQEAEYFSDFMSFSANETTRSLEINVWDSTEDSDVIKVVTAHTIVYTAPNTLQVTEYYLFTNDSDKTYIGSDFNGEEGKKKTLSFTLPVGVTEFQPTIGLMDCCIFGTEDGFVDTMPVMPGMREISYQYSVVPESSDFTIPQRIYYPTVSYDLLVQGGDVEVDVDQLTVEDPMNNDGVLYSHLSGKNLAPGNTLLIKLSGLPQAGNENAILWVIFALVLLGGIFGLGYSLRKSKAETVPAEGSYHIRQEKLLVKLAQLDDDFESGKIQENAYRSQRDSTKVQLLKLMKKADGGKGSS